MFDLSLKFVFSITISYFLNKQNHVVTYVTMFQMLIRVSGLILQSGENFGGCRQTWSLL